MEYYYTESEFCGETVFDVIEVDATGKVVGRKFMRLEELKYLNRWNATKLTSEQMDEIRVMSAEQQKFNDLMLRVEQLKKQNEETSWRRIERLRESGDTKLMQIALDDYERWKE